jgi:hypothetical protein
MHCALVKEPGIGSELERGCGEPVEILVHLVKRSCSFRGSRTPSSHSSLPRSRLVTLVAKMRWTPERGTAGVAC